MNAKRKTARAIAAAIADGADPAAAIRESLEGIALAEPRLRAFAHLDPQAALAAAQRAPRGPLAGVPVGVKDIFDTADLPTECGSALCAGRRPLRDASSVAAIRAAGAVVIGKTETTEFAYAHPGRTTNPHNSAHTPGGSSSGSAAAVAAGLIPLGIGTQTAGSIIRPASFCGVVGYKPSFGLINRTGVWPCAESFDTIGVFARTVDDAALLVGAITGRSDLMAPLSPRPPRRIGLCRTPDWAKAASESREAVEATARRLEAAGSAIIEVSLPGACDDLQQVHKDIMAHEASRVFAHERHVAQQGLSEILSTLIADGLAVTAERYAQRLDQAEAARAAMTAVFADVDVILTPSASGEAPEGLASTGDALFNRVWTLLWGPAIHLPTGFGPTGLPVGVQLVGPTRGDAATLAAAGWAEAVL